MEAPPKLRHLRIASPCSAEWDQMKGDDRARFCDRCKLNVYNLTAMTAAEAERLIEEHEGRLCVRFYQRADGTVLTSDCPVGKQLAELPKLRRNSLIASALAFLGVMLFKGPAVSVPMMGASMPRPPVEAVTGAIPEPPTIEPKMGDLTGRPGLEWKPLTGIPVHAPPEQTQ